MRHCIDRMHIPDQRFKEWDMAKKAGGKRTHRDSAKDSKQHKRGDKR